MCHFSLAARSQSARLRSLGKACQHMQRREFMTLLGGVSAWPLAARAQQASDQRLIGVLSPISETAAERNVEALRAGLRELGYTEGRNIRLEIRYADGAIERLPQLAAELVGFGPAVIVAGSPPAAIAARNGHADSDHHEFFAGPGGNWVGRQYCATGRQCYRVLVG